MTPQQRYRLKNKEKLLEKDRARYRSNIEYQLNRSQQYRLKNKDFIKAKRTKKAKEKRLTDPLFKLKENFSRHIRRVLTKRNSSKDSSFLKKIGYSLDELKFHLESQFELWMSWENYGIYTKSKWNDNDQSTWTWNIDHIIPQSTFEYSSMDDDNFKKCWGLDNLRPLSSKQNFLYGLKLPKNKRKV